MKYETIETEVVPVIREFVTHILNQRYVKHCSDDFLVSLIKYSLLTATHHNKELTKLDAIIAGDENIAYEAVCYIFESILEHECKAGGNGHHVAQSFAKFFNGHFLDETV
jgi:hypothetical protein